MKQLIFLSITFLLLLGIAFGQTSTIVLTHANLIEVETGKVISDQTIIIENDRITQVGLHKKVKIPSDAQVIDASNKWVMPGMVDSHIHLFQSGGLYTRPDAIDLRKYVPYEEERQWLKEHADDLLKRYLACGITSVVDVGGPLYNYAIRDQFNAIATSPTIYLTGPLISTYQPEEFQVEDPPIIKTNSTEEARELVRKQLPYKPDFIKIWYIARSEAAAKETYPIIKATIEEANKHGLKVAVHATQLETARLAVKAGAHFLVHSVDDAEVDDAFLKELKDKGVVYCPTMIVGGHYGETFLTEYQPTTEDYAIANPDNLGSLFDLRHLPEDRIKSRYQSFSDNLKKRDKVEKAQMSANLIKLAKKGIIIASGTDAGNIGTLHASSYYEELAAMKKAGMSPAQILLASTLNGAKSVGKADEFGTLKVGKRADILILNKNPLEDLSHLKEIELVINKGVPIRPDSLIQATPAQLAQQQLNAYNGHNLEAFLAPYSEDVKIYTFPNKLSLEGKEAMRKQYQFIEQAPDLHCELVNRIVQGNTVIDQERVIVDKNRPPIHAIAVYKIRDGKIAEVYFMN